MKNRGNFLHNIDVLKAKEGNLLVVRRPKEDIDASKYSPCSACLGFFSKYNLWSHKCVSENNKPSGNVLKESQTLLQSVLHKQSPQLIRVLNTLRHDPVTDAVKADRLICKFMDIELEKYDYQVTKERHTRSKARELGRLLLHVRNNNEQLDGCQFQDLLVPNHFDILIKAVMELSHTDGNEATSLPIKLGQTITKLVNILMGEGIRDGDDSRIDICRRFTLLYEAEWSDRVSLKQRKKLHDRRLNKTVEIPRTEDVIKLAADLALEAEKRAEDFIKAPGSRTGRLLSEVVLAQLVCFNKRRGGEASKIELKHYHDANEIWTNTDYNTELYSMLSEEEKLMARGHFLARTIGKAGKHVPIIFTLKMKIKVDLLIKHRQALGIPENNKYVFGKPGCDSNLITWDILRHFCGKYQVGRITSTSLRRYLATTAQGFRSIEHLFMR